MNQYLNEVQKALKSSFPRVKDLKKHRAFHKQYKNSQLSTLCLKMVTADERRLNKSGFSFYNLSEKEVNKIWDFIWKNAKYYEVMNQALMYYQHRREDLTLVHWEFLKMWSTRIENWAHSDILSDIYAHLHERYPKDVYPVFVKWNTSKHPWQRRLSIVSTFYYANSRKIRQPKFQHVMPLVKNVFYDDHIYVQKGIGWTLRELYNVYPQKTFAFLKKHATEISPIAWQASTEKLSKNNKELLKQLRKRI